MRNNVARAVIVALATHLGLDRAEEEVLGGPGTCWLDAEFRSGIILRRGVCTIRARSVLNAAAWWGSPAGLAAGSSPRLAGSENIRRKVSDRAHNPSPAQAVRPRSAATTWFDDARRASSNHLLPSRNSNVAEQERDSKEHFSRSRCDAAEEHVHRRCASSSNLPRTPALSVPGVTASQASSGVDLQPRSASSSTTR